MTMLSALVAGVISPLLSSSVLALAAGQLAFVMVGFVLWNFARIDRLTST
jgi:DHA1 family bicyclomycin/chloramphenicol resistance-like MFS transporter